MYDGEGNVDLGDIEEWWKSVNGFKPSVEVFDDDGEYINGQEPTDEVMEQWHRERNKWEAHHPLPFELVHHCHGEEPMYILALPGTVFEARRGDPVEVNLPDITGRTQEIEAIRAFCAKHHMEVDKPSWWLSSYWG